MSWEMLGSSYLCANTWIETKDFNARFGVERGPRCTSIQLEAFAFPLPAAWKPLQQRPDGWWCFTTMMMSLDPLTRPLLSTTASILRPCLEECSSWVSSPIRRPPIQHKARHAHRLWSTALAPGETPCIMTTLPMIPTRLHSRSLSESRLILPRRNASEAFRSPGRLPNTIWSWRCNWSSKTMVFAQLKGTAWQATWCVRWMSLSKWC